MISIGVSGHRHLENIDTIADLVDIALEKVVTAFDDRAVRMHSPLAEGADRLVAGAALDKFEARLFVTLPLKLKDYMKDFDTISSKAEFLTLLEQAEKVIELPEGDSRELSYQAAGLYVLDHSDVLVAIWDGEPARGVGGTGDIVNEARNRRLPMAWVHTNEQDPERITYENFNAVK